MRELQLRAATELILGNSQPIAGKVTRALEMRRADAPRQSSDGANCGTKRKKMIKLLKRGRSLIAASPAGGGFTARSRPARGDGGIECLNMQ